MIQSARVHNFKCWRDLDLPLGLVTLVTGLNGSGKSTMIQAFALCAQSVDQGLLAQGRLALNGGLVQLGRAEDVRSEDAEDDDVGLGFTWTDGTRWDARLHVEGDVLLGGPTTSPDRPPFNGRVQLLSASRVGAEVAYPMSAYEVAHRRRLGPRGEFAAHFLAEHGRQPLTHPQLAHPDAASDGLLDQVEAWLGEVSPGVRLYVTTDHDLDQVKVQYSFAGPYGPGNRFRPTNVGYGLSYALPLLTAALGSAEGELLLVENPESHLHPRGQARLMELLCRVSRAGVQVVVETHSDHVLNGLRLAVHGGHLEPEHARIHYFVRGAGGHRVVSPSIDHDGRLDQWPEGFFDEWELALGRLIEPRSGG